MRQLLLLLTLMLSACANSPSIAESAGASDAVIYVAAEIVTMERRGGVAEAVAVRGSEIAGVGALAELRRRFPAAAINRTFADRVIVPGLIDPHMHVVLGSLMYAQPFAPPWPMATPEGMSAGYPNHDAFMARLREIVAAAPDDGSPIVAYGFHNLIQGDIDRLALDTITRGRPLIVWHYSGHDLYLNSRALDLIGATPALAETYHGVDLAPDGTLTGRLYEDAGFYAFRRLGAVLFNPDALARGSRRYFEIVRRAGVTTTADLAYGVFGLQMENGAIASSWSMQRDGFRLYLVPEYRSFEREFGSATAAAAVVHEMAEGRRQTAAPVLPRVKFFADGAFYSQTMRLSPPGYLAGQSHGALGQWVIPPDRIAATMRPYLQAGLAAHIHSNGDAAQTATLDALAELRGEGFAGDFVIEHGGLFSPPQVRQAARLDAMVSAASHYAFYMGHLYRQPLGPGRARWISPLGSLSRAGVVVALHSDAPLAPPQPLRAASVQLTRATRDDGPYEARQALTRYDALEAITLDAARVLGLETEIGSLEVGKRADFTILDASPLRTPGAESSNIGVWGVVLDGQIRPIQR